MFVGEPPGNHDRVLFVVPTVDFLEDPPPPPTPGP
jgi:hypothetical protein